MLLVADTFDKAVWNFKIALCKRKKQKAEFISIDISNTYVNLESSFLTL